MLAKCEIVGVSERDILLQLYVEKKISRVEMEAGRLWQRYMTEATIQPCVSFDPATPVSQARLWQPDGDLTDRQYTAIRHRRIIEQAIGRGPRSLLDALLEPDVGRSAIIRTYGLASRQLVERLRYFLKEIAVCFGMSTKILMSDPDIDPGQLAQDAILLDKDSNDEMKPTTDTEHKG